MLDVLILAAPIYLLIATGFGLIKTEYLPPSILSGLGQFVLKLCVPVLIFMAVARPGSLMALNWWFTGGYAAAALLTAALVTIIMVGALDKPLSPALIFGLGGGSANTIFLGLPVAMIVFPELAITCFAWVMIAENLIVIPLLVALADSASTGSKGFFQSLRSVLSSFLKSPLMAALGLGLLVSGLNITLPGPIEATLTMIRAAAPVISLVLVGGFVATEKLQGLGTEVAVIVIAKLLVHPALTGAILWALPGVDWQTALCAVLISCVPMFTIFTIFAAKHGGGATASGALIATTLTSAVTVTAILVAVSALVP